MQQGTTGPGTYLPFVQLLWPYPPGIYHNQEDRECLCSLCQPELCYGPLVCSIDVRAEQLDPNSKVRHMIGRILSLLLHKVAIS